MSISRFGPARQALHKPLVIHAGDIMAVSKALCSVALPRIDGQAITVAADKHRRNVLWLDVPLVWLGSQASRNDAFGLIGSSVASLARAAREAGGRILPAAVTERNATAVLAGDVHVLEAITTVEQEVLCNLLRRMTPQLIALTGHGVVRPGPIRDRVGSRWLLGSREHLAARYLASVSPQHLERVVAALRRDDGVARLDRMDVAPGAPAGRRTHRVLVRCIDSQAFLATTRALAVLLAAIAVRARRMVRRGSREGMVPQALLERNRARAVAQGLRARFEENRGRDGAAADGAPGLPARRAVSELLFDLAPEFSDVDATPDELAPLTLAVELAALGVVDACTEHDLLSSWAATGNQEQLFDHIEAVMADPGPGGPLLARLREQHPVQSMVVARAWNEALERQ